MPLLQQDFHQSQINNFLFISPDFDFHQLFNKMFGPPQSHREQILRLPQTQTLQPSLRMCTSQQLPRQGQYRPFPGIAPKPKISIKQLLRKRSLNTQSYASFSQVSQRQVQEDPRTVPLEKGRSPVSCTWGAERTQNVQNNHAFNYIFGECVIRPQQMRIFYHNSPLAKTQHTPPPNQTNFNYPQPRIESHAKLLERPANSFTFTPPVTAVPTPAKEQPAQGKKQKSEAFNELMSFGPKHFDLFKNMQALQINDVTSHILEETERTDLDAHSQTDKKRLTKTFSEARIRNERDRFAGGSQLGGGSPFARSNMFRSIKKTETMGGKEDSDHESEVVEKFESLMQKVRENRLDNSIIDI